MTLIDEVRPVPRRNTPTHRQLEVLLLIAEGLTDKEIASRLGIATATVKSHVSALLIKLGVARRAGAVSVAFRRGWLPRGGRYPKAERQG